MDDMNDQVLGDGLKGLLKKFLEVSEPFCKKVLTRRRQKNEKFSEV